jgi:hypothetical protein
MLPVRLMTNGIAYLGFRSRSTTPKNAPYSLLLSQLFLTAGVSRMAWGGGECVRAAARMKGVVKPQASPIKRNPST